MYSSDVLSQRTDGTMRPLVIDLDGTLIYSDLLWESLLLFLKQHFWQAWRLPFWLLGGKAAFKERLAQAVAFDPSTLPYDQHLLKEIRAQRALGRTIVLATGSQRRLAEQIAEHLQLFDLVAATGDGINLTGRHKATHLNSLYGDRNFDYVGNSRVDIPVWHASHGAYSVTHKPFRLPDGRSTSQLGSHRPGAARYLLKGMRPRQWLKNMLVFVPMLTGHAFGLTTLTQSLVAFVAFSLCASSAYLLNDALDAGDDRRHPTKCKRPIAAGLLPLPLALLTSPLLALVAIALSALFDPLLLLTLSFYFVTTVCYSLYLKRLLMIDIVTLSMLYTLRILGGSAATHITPSFWLLAFSFFIFLSLALLKRYSELFNLHKQGKDKTSGRGYTTADKVPVGTMGVACGFLSVLIFMLYFNSETVLQMYGRPYLLMGIVPLLVFWLGRLWLLAYRGLVNEDPVLYVSKDKTSLLIIGLCAAIAGAASW
ncbi:UbiA family prenyltransferase [Pseudoduganella buxea]|uniref:Membrane protein n=1 Tax=Pseudoduganella buxea TaxID=1949069 RepID=A0A6I3SYQ7_9BURK|nr:UbiA family prenyltransferase [Pseudoduganella buxea]MTV53392.1 UbiA family prenyltransferase [Pseudoduganella buxea]GGC06955.1 membrane protein [Pseudoduganella buxea]